MYYIPVEGKIETALDISIKDDNSVMNLLLKCQILQYVIQF